MPKNCFEDSKKPFPRSEMGFKKFKNSFLKI